MEPEYDPRLSKARAEYFCTGSRNNPCAKKILPGERYFNLVIIRGNFYRTVRYCLECAALLYPDLIVIGVNRIKSEKNLKQTRKALNQQQYLNSKASKFKKVPSSPAEEFLWTLLRGSQLGVSFQRQKVLHGYIVDFWCPSLRLAIELDGQHHLSRRQKDRARDQFLNDHGVRVLRFPSRLLFQDPGFVLDQIRLHSKK
jgi:very-short-patch-repair endonuclease